MGWYIMVEVTVVLEVITILHWIYSLGRCVEAPIVVVVVHVYGVPRENGFIGT